MNKYVATFRIHIQESFQYFADLIATGFVTLLYVFIFYSLWRTIYTQHQVAGFTLTAMVWYFAVAQILRSGGGRPVKDISSVIQDGTISNYMNKPISFLWFQASTQIGRNFATLISSSVLVSVFVYFVIGAPDTAWFFIPLVAITILLGLVINFLMGFAIATSAFWVEDANPLHWIYDKIVFLLGGLLFPIDLLPDFFMKIARFLPTSYFVYYPARLLANFELSLFFEVIIGQIFYLFVLVFLGNFLLKRGTKKLSVNGG